MGSVVLRLTLCRQKAKQTILAAALSIQPLLLSTSLHADQSEENETANPRTVKELYYGEILFDYFKQDYLNALTKVQARVRKNQLTEHKDDAMLLDANISVNYGLFKHAKVLLEDLLSETAAQQLTEQNKQLAWLYMAKMALAYDLSEQAQQALSQSKDLLSPEQQIEALYLQSQQVQSAHQLSILLSKLAQYSVSLNQDEDEDMAEPLWLNYVRYNLAIAAVGFNQIEKAKTLLQQITKIHRIIESSDEERTLSDHSALALASLQLSSNQYKDAIASLKGIQLKGPLSQQAFYSYGWALYKAGQISQAMVPWQQLANHAQANSPWRWQAQLALANALEEQSNPTALSHYIQAADRFQQQQSKLTDLQRELSANQVETLLYEWMQKQQANSVNFDAPMLQEYHGLFADLLTSDKLQSTLNNYQQINRLASNLTINLQKLQVFSNTIITRAQARRNQLVLLNSQNFADNLATLEARLSHYQSLLQQANQGHPELLANEQQSKWLTRLNKAFEINALLAQSRDVSYNQERLERIQGVLYWQLEKNFPNNRWQVEKALRASQALLDDTKVLHQRLQQYSHQPDGLEPLQKELLRLTENTQIKLSEAKRIQQELNGHIHTLMIEVIENHQRQLNQLYAHALLAITRIKDSSFQQNEGDQ